MCALMKLRIDKLLAMYLASHVILVHQSDPLSED